MKIGIDIQQLTSPVMSGLYFYERQLLGGLRAIKPSDRVILFVRYTDKWKEHESLLRARVGGLGFAVRWYGVARPPYRLRERLNAIHRVSVFLHVTNPRFLWTVVVVMCSSFQT